MILIATTSTNLLHVFGGERFMHRSWSTVSTFDAMLEALRCLQPSIVLLDADLPQMPRGSALEELASTCESSKLIVLHRSFEDQMELDFFRYANARGCCPIDASPEHLERAIAAVERGEVWIRRQLIGKLVEDHARLRREQRQNSRTRPPAELTQREKEIALLVSAGNSNKQIARLLSITERTVKAHVSEIFRKTDTRDRLTLALRFAGPLERARVLPPQQSALPQQERVPAMRGA